MNICIALLANTKLHNLGRKITFDMNQKYETGIESARLPQHVSLKQTFFFDKNIDDLEKYLETFFEEMKIIKIKVEKLEVNYVEEKALIWLKIKKDEKLKKIHEKLCAELKEKFDIEPIGYDGEKWEFHSTLAYTKLEILKLNEIKKEYDGMKIDEEFELKEAVILCSTIEEKEEAKYFSLRKFDLKK